MPKTKLPPRQATVLDSGDIQIPLANNLGVATVSAEDRDLADYRWFVNGNKMKEAARTRLVSDPSGPRNITMARIILSRILGGAIPNGIECDHANHNKFDNRRTNLRPATRSENSRNRRGWSPHAKGVTWDKKTKRFHAILQIGTFETEEEAAEAWRRAAKKIQGEFMNHEE